MKSYLQAAKEYHAAGLHTIPFWNEENGKKRFPADYAKYRESQTSEDIDRLFSVNADGICLLCTDGIEAIDIDTKHDERGTIVEELCSAIDEFGFDMPRIVQKTKSGGLHIVYRCPNPDGNRKVARRRGNPEAVIETRGKGGLLFIWPTPGYEIISGDFLNIPEVTQDQRNNMIRLCEHLNEPEPETFERNLKNPASKNIEGKAPWTAFDESTNILDMMEQYGWRVIGARGDYVRLNRPGAKNSRGVDASVIQPTNLFYPFTSSEQFEPNKAYSPSSVFAIMEHGGDFSAAARDLYYKGYGDRVNTKSAAEPAKVAELKAALPGLIERANATRFDYFQKDAYIHPLLTFMDSGKDYPIAGRGMLGLFSGHEKSGKSFVLSYIESCGIGRLSECLNFHLDLDGGSLLHFDTEQSLYFYQKTQRRILTNAKVNGNTASYNAFHLRRFSPMERVEIIEHYVTSIPNVSVLVIDGFVDLVVDYNSIEKVNAVMQRLMQWSDQYNILILGVLHLNKGDGKLRGHIGTEMKNKFDFIIDVKQYEQGSYRISNPTSRFAPFPEMEFKRGESGEAEYVILSDMLKPKWSDLQPKDVFNQSNSAQSTATRNDDVPF